MPINKTVTSKPDERTGQITIMEISKADSGAMTMSVKLQGQTDPFLTANILDLFSIQFIKHNLTGSGAAPNFSYWGYVDYRPSASNPPVLPEVKDTTVFGVPGIALEYKSVDYTTVTPANKPPDLPKYVTDVANEPDVKKGTGEGLGKIDVIVTIYPAMNPNRTFNYGWINFDITHTYPAKFPEQGTDAALRAGWEERLVYPVIQSMQLSTPPDEKSTSKRLDNLISELGYAAYYVVETFSDKPSRALGIALHKDDDRGHHKTSYFNPSNSELSFQLLNPVHLKETANGPAYVKPPGYALAGGDNYGFGGNLMGYRLRAFEINSVSQKLPIERRDVLDIYRKWIIDRKPLFYRKYRERAPFGPMDSMAPQTVVNNFSPDGPVDPGTDAKMAAWLEQHPAKEGQPCVPGNKNESLLRLLSRLRSKFNMWSGWEDLGGGLKAGPAVASWGENRLDCFVWGTDDQLYHLAFDNGWGNWMPLGGVLTSNPAAVSWGLNRIDCFVRGIDNQLYQKSFIGGWQPWVPLGGGLTSGPAASSWGENRLDVFVRGTDNALWYRTFDNGWKNWMSLGGALTSNPAAVSWGLNHIDVFARGTDGAIYQITLDGSSWSGWKRLGSISGTVQVASAPAVSSWGPNRLDLFVRGSDNALWHRIFDGAWGSWRRVGGSFDNAPAAVSMKPDRIDCFVRGLPNSTLSHVWSDVTRAYNRPVLEAQVWDAEMAGLYRFYGGFPTTTDVLSSPGRFKSAMDDLASAGIIPLFTTDPLSCILSRKRFRGHLIKDSAGKWDWAIPHPFPDAVKNSTCAATDVSISQPAPGYTNNRVWYVEKEANVTPAPDPEKSCGELSKAEASRKTDEFGRIAANVAPGALGNGFYRSLGTQMCPTPDIERIYLDSWLQNGWLAYGGRLIEFMKHTFNAAGYCYNRNHRHIVPPDPNHPVDPPDPSDPPDPASLPYTNVIGRGFWYIRRCRSMLRGAQNRGLARYGSFTLTTEFSPTESMLPYVDEHYSINADMQFVYSNMLVAKIGAYTDFTTPPGYKEQRKNPLLRVAPVELLSPDRDKPDPNKPDPPVTDADLDMKFSEWLGFCTKYFDDNFVVSDPGLSPQNYDIVNKDGTTSKYSYRRAVQETFNLRARICDIGQAAINGYRIIVPAVYLEEPYDYNEEVVNFASRAAELQYRHSDFFLDGFIAGTTPFRQHTADAAHTELKPLIWTWGSFYIHRARPFNDVQMLVDRVKAEDNFLGKEYQKLLFGDEKKTFKFYDYIAQPVDRRTYYYRDPDKLDRILQLDQSNIIFYPRVPHLIWQTGEANPAKVLYLFGNVSNIPVEINFNYDRGLNVPAGATWSKTITRITGEGNSQQGNQTVKFNQEETLVIAPRSFLSIELKR